MQLNMNKLSGNSRKLTSYGDSSFTEDFSLVFLAHRLLRENQKPKLIIQGTREMLSWQMDVLVHGCLLPFSETNKQHWKMDYRNTLLSIQN